jgi:creatinine amidohydrolase/Fe(II)-dependent formamide hydrolase-like protein
MKYDPNLHHRRSIRLKGYDYSQAGAYFVTVNTHQGEALLGEIVAGEMQLNDWGQIVAHCWNDIPEHFPHADTDEFIIMPNHIHGIVIITDDVMGSDAKAAPHVRAGFPRPNNAAETSRTDNANEKGAETAPQPPQIGKP